MMYTVTTIGKSTAQPPKNFLDSQLPNTLCRACKLACCQTFSGAACPWMVWMRHDRTDAKGQRSHCSKKGLCAFNLCVLSLTCDAVPHLPGGVGMADAPSFWCSCQALLLVQQLPCILHTVTTGLETRLITICPIGGSISCTIPCEGPHVDPRAG